MACAARRRAAHCEGRLTVATVEHPPDKRSPPGEGGHRDQQKQSGIILPFPRRECIGCGIPFLQRRPWHDRCSSCYRWSIAAFHIRAARLTFGGTR